MLVGSRWNQLHVESDFCHSIYLRRKLLLLAGSRWNLLHVEPDCSIPRNNLAHTILCEAHSTRYFHNCARTSNQILNVYSLTLRGADYDEGRE